MTSTLVASKKNWRKKRLLPSFFFYWVFPTETAIITALIRFDILMGSMLYSNGFVSMASKFGDAARNRKLQRKKKKKNGENQIFLGQISMSGKYASGVLFFSFTRVTGFFFTGFHRVLLDSMGFDGIVVFFYFFLRRSSLSMREPCHVVKREKKEKKKPKNKNKKEEHRGFFIFSRFSSGSQWCDVFMEMRHSRRWNSTRVCGRPFIGRGWIEKKTGRTNGRREKRAVAECVTSVSTFWNVARGETPRISDAPSTFVIIIIFFFFFIFASSFFFIIIIIFFFFVFFFSPP